MTRMNLALVSGLLAAFMLLGPCSSLLFSDRFAVRWAQQNIVADDATGNVQISLTKDSGAQFESKQSYLHGYFSARIKLVKGESAGTVCTFYVSTVCTLRFYRNLTSYGENHDEIDFEFLGNETGQPYVLHTNVFANGVGGREQQVYMWFDPTADFHTYSVIWNHYQIRWLVDDTLIRIYKKIEGIYPASYPESNLMVAAASIFDASSWATRGGRAPVNYYYAPFTVNYQHFHFDACQASSGSCSENHEANWWEDTAYRSLSSSQESQLKQFQQTHMIYDYCHDWARYPAQRPECPYNTIW